MSVVENKELPSDVSPQWHRDIRGQVTKILDSEQFKSAARARTLFEYLVNEWLAGREASIKTILQDVYRKDSSANHATASMAVGDVRTRLDAYYGGEGAGDPWRIEIPVGKFVPRCRINAQPAPADEAPGPDPAPPATVPLQPNLVTGNRTGRPAWVFRSALVVALVAVVVLGVMIAQPGSGIRITSPADGAAVGPVADVSGKGWQPKMNNYLVVEPVDHSGRRWIQFQIASPEWTHSAYFGQADTPKEMKFRLYVLSTPTEMPIAEITKLPASPQESPAVTVVLKK